MEKKYSLIHITDIHLNFCNENKIRKFCENVVNTNPDGIVITGDISEAPTLVDHLGILKLFIGDVCPIFFVLGNHDFYQGSIVDVRSTMSKLFSYNDKQKSERKPRLVWLGSSGIVPLTNNVALVGDDGWYDGQYANWFTSNVILNDYFSILELSGKMCQFPIHKFEKINELSKNSAEYIKVNIIRAFKDFQHVFVATHVPPFRESSTYQGKISNDDWMPHFSSKAMGDVLENLATTYQNKNITVLCGHTHGSSNIHILPNLHVITGGAVYGEPKVSGTYKL